MPDVNVEVKQGTCTYVPWRVSVGTRGCECCVGIVAILVDGTVFCGHMDSSAEPKPAEKQGYCNRVEEILKKVLPPGVKIKELSYVTERGMRSSQYIAETVARLYQQSNPKDMSQVPPANDGLYCADTRIHPVKHGAAFNVTGLVGGDKKMHLLFQKFSV